MKGSEEESDDDVGDVLEAIGYSRLHLLTKLDQDVSFALVYLGMRLLTFLVWRFKTLRTILSRPEDQPSTQTSFGCVAAATHRW
jgi:hypothetical protein